MRFCKQGRVILVLGMGCGFIKSWALNAYELEVILTLKLLPREELLHSPLFSGNFHVSPVISLAL